MAAFASVYYMGFCSVSETINVFERCTAGIEKAEKWHGHLYNWHDITNLQPLELMYVSSVDSVNLACYLVLMDAVLPTCWKQSLHLLFITVLLLQHVPKARRYRFITMQTFSAFSMRLNY